MRSRRQPASACASSREREEAVLTFVGVTKGELPDQPLIVADIGGGSTEALTFIPGHGHLRRPHPARLCAPDQCHRPARSADRRGGQPTAGRGLRRDGRFVVQPRDSTRRRTESGGSRAVFVGGTATNVARLGRLTRSAMAEDRRTLERMSVRRGRGEVQRQAASGAAAGRGRGDRRHAARALRAGGGRCFRQPACATGRSSPRRATASDGPRRSRRCVSPPGRPATCATVPARGAR